MKEEDVVLRHLMKKVNPNYKQTLDDEILDRIGEFIFTTSKENLVLIEHWIRKTRSQREGKKDGTGWHR